MPPPIPNNPERIPVINPINKYTIKYMGLIYYT